MAKIHVDGRPFEAKDGDNLLHACLSFGLDLPYFCWHPALHSVGACRQCAVKQFKDEKDTRGRIVMACMTQVTEGMRVSIDDPEAKAFRAKVVEFLMVSHPHDCPVCDEGGECHLQDMTVMTGHTYRKYRFPKATFRNQDLGPFLNHEMNRCIEYYRCVRFYRDHAGGRDLNVFGVRDRIYFGREEDGVLESEFSGNLAEVCPTGVFTDKTLGRHYTRKWDLCQAPSICAHCGVGCNTIAAERYGGLRRIQNRFNEQVNGYFLCDRGRFGYEFVNSDRRIRSPLARSGGSGKTDAVVRDEVLRRIREIIGDGTRAAGIGSPRASLESNFALRELVGPSRFSPGFGPGEAPLVALVLRILREGAVRTPSIADVETSDAVLVLGEDPTATAARLALAIRQSVRRAPMALAERLGIPPWHDAAVREAVGTAKGPLFIAAPWPTRLDDVAAEPFRAAPDDIAILGAAVAREIHAGSPDPGPVTEAVRILAGKIAAALKGARKPLVVSGIASGSEAVIRAAADVALALKREGKDVGLVFALPEANTAGAALLGGVGIDDVARVLREGAADVLIVLENDLFRRGGSAWASEVLGAARRIIAIDHIRTPVTDRADLVLPAASFAEGDGTFVSAEGRAQRYFQVFQAETGEIQEAWRWVRDILALTGRPAGGWVGLDDIVGAVAAAVPSLVRIPEAAPGADFRIAGQKIPRASHRQTGRTAVGANISVHEPMPPDDIDTPLSFTMEGYRGKPPAPLNPFFWAPGWNSIQSLNKFQAEVGGPLRGGPPGVRLIEPAGGEGLGFLGGAPMPFEPRREALLVLPIPHLFGSEELSAIGPAIASRAPAPYLAISPEDAAERGLQAGQEVEAVLPGRKVRLPVEIRPGLARGVAAVPAGFPGLEGIDLPAWCEFARTR